MDLTARKKPAPPALRDAHLPPLAYDEAIGSVVERIRPLHEVTLPVLASRGRVLAATVYARWDLPTADNSAMDGYAFRFESQRPGDVLTVIGNRYCYSRQTLAFHRAIHQMIEQL